MTVCIAAICQVPAEPDGPVDDRAVPVILACSDRMITQGLTEFRPNQSKYYSFAPYAPATVAFVAGSISPQVIIGDETARHLRENPTTRVREITQTWAEAQAAHQRALAQQEVLDPYGLTHETFLQLQASLDPSFVRQVSLELTGVSLGTQTIITGLDDEGAHIFLVQDRALITGSGLPGIVQCETPGGFSAIGSGAYHAHSLFTAANYDRRWPIHRALYLLYSARRRAEAAPGVGDQADWWIIANGTTAPLYAPVVEEVTRQYDAESRRASARRDRIEARIGRYLGEMVAKAAAATSKPAGPPVQGEAARLPAAPAGSQPGLPGNALPETG